MEYKEHKIGERFKDGNTLLETVKSIHCSECFYGDENGSTEPCGRKSKQGPCCPSDRIDKTDVIFKEIKYMKEENKDNFYIWGVKDRGYEVLKVLFENNNMKDYINKFVSLYFGQEGCLYIVNKSHGVRTFEKNIDDDIINLITSNWTELKLPYKPKDKELVWAYYEADELARVAIFFDAINGCCFSEDGNRNGDSYDNYEPFEGEYPQWAKEALSKLEE